MQSTPLEETNQETEGQELDFRTYLYLLLHHWYWLLLGLLLGLAGVYSYLRYAPVVYKVNASILIADKEGDGFSEQALLGELGFDQKTKIDDQIEVFKSSNLMRRVIDSLDLQNQFISKGRVKSSDVYENFHLVRLDSSQQVLRFEMEVLDSSQYSIRLDESLSLIHI